MVFRFTCAVGGDRKRDRDDPASDIIETPAAQGTADAFDYLRVKYISGGESICYLRSYDRKRKGAGHDPRFCLVRREPELDYYTECLTALIPPWGWCI